MLYTCWFVFDWRAFGLEYLNSAVSRRTAIPRAGRVSGRFASAPQPARSVPRSQPRSGAARDAQRLRLRARRVRQDHAAGLRLHVLGRRRGVHACAGTGRRSTGSDWFRAGSPAWPRSRPRRTFLGMNLAFPILISPTARHVLFHPDAEAATHAGATAASNTPLIVSNVATLPVEKIAAAATGPWWFQLYPQPGPDYNRQTLEKAQAAGCRAIVVTVDQQASVYERSTHDQNLATPACPDAGADYRRAAAAPRQPVSRPGRQALVRMEAARRTPPRWSRFRWSPKASSRGKMRACAWNTESMPSSCPTMAAGRWTTALPRSKCCRKSPMPSRAASRFSSTAAYAAAATF